MDTTEAAQRTDGSTVNVGKAQVKLHYLVAGKLAAVRDGDGCIDRLSGFDLRLRQGQPAVTECRVAEPVAERPQRHAGEIAIGPPFHRVILELRKLVDVRVKCDGQPSARIVGATQRVG